MNRRDLLGLSLGFASIAGTARAQGRPPVVAFVNDTGATAGAPVIAVLRGLGRQGFVTNQTFLMMQRPIEKYEEAAAVAADLVKRGVDAIVALESPNTALAVRDAAKATPVIFAGAYDPVALGLVQSLEKPGGNATGVLFTSTAVVDRRADIAAAIAGVDGKVGVLVNLADKAAEAQKAAYVAAMKARNRSAAVFEADSAADIDAAFARAAAEGFGAMIVADDPRLSRMGDKLIAAAAARRTPALHATRDEVVAGGLVCHGDARADQLFKLGEMIGRTLKGEKPGAIPVVTVEKTLTSVNAKTAAALGLDPGSKAFEGAEVLR
jgi:putative ABC transport system substrate-binding protein